MPSLRDALKERIITAVKPKEPEPKKELVDEYDMLMAKFERDLGKFPFAALWPQPQEGSLVKILVIAITILQFITMIAVFVKK